MQDLVAKLRRLYEENLRQGTWDDLTEMPHWDFGKKSPLPGDHRVFGVIDFQVEKMSVSAEHKKQLRTAFVTIGFVGYSQIGRGWLFFSNGAKGQPELGHATAEQVKECPHLPDDWETHMVHVPSD